MGSDINALLNAKYSPEKDKKKKEWGDIRTR
jgi:hypothetical protein